MLCPLSYGRSTLLFNKLCQVVRWLRRDVGHRFQPRVSDRFPENLVGARGFEPPTSCSQSRRATGLRYAPVFSERSSLRFKTSLALANARPR